MRVKTRHRSFNFVRSKVSNIVDGRTEVIYEEGSTEPKPFRMIASPSGIRFEGRLQGEIMSMPQLQDWAELTSEIWKEHMRLIPRLSKTLAGHS